MRFGGNYEKNNFLSALSNNFIENFFDPSTLIGTIGGLAITAGLIASGPLGWGVAALLIGSGVFMVAYSSGLFDNFGQPDAGYTDIYNWLEFGVSVALSSYGGKSTYIAGKAAFDTITTSISSYTINYSIKTTTQISILSFSRQSIQTNVIKYSAKQELKTICRITLGENVSKAIIKILKEQLQSSGIVSGIQFLQNQTSNI